MQPESPVMEVIWQSEAGNASQEALRLIINDYGCIMFQYRSVELSDWTDVDEVPFQFELAF